MDPCCVDPPIDLFSSWIELGEGGAVKPRSRAASGEWGLWTVAAFHVTDNDSVHSDIWERHPAGDEMLFLLSGAVTVHLRDQAGGEVATTSLPAGACRVVPAGKWHRLTVEEAGDLMVITARLNTEHQTETNEPEPLGISHR
ncbi:cupin domain-containing protein [Mycobacterium alsense]|uniref:cupin domain-containing protein n=1 Tax=Mycobacterium alsense TaxID=324058 RepID=UPI0013F4F0A5|nr:cupin domain-containing protein [Mycobacterium alsense]